MDRIFEARSDFEITFGDLTRRKFQAGPITNPPQDVIDHPVFRAMTREVPDPETAKPGKPHRDDTAPKA